MSIFGITVSLWLIGLTCSSADEPNDADIKLQCGDETIVLANTFRIKDTFGSSDEFVINECPAELRNALVHLSEVVDPNVATFCSQQKADQILKHLSFTRNKSYPEGVKKFFIAYGLLVSDVCRKQLVNQLIDDSEKYLKGEDFGAMGKLTDENGLLGKLFNDNDEAIVPSLFVKMLKAQGQEISEEKLTFQMDTGRAIEIVKTICNRRLAPIYEPLIMPILTLSTIGFNYKANTDTVDAMTSRKAHQWYRMAFVCESLRNIALVESREDREICSGTDRRRVTITSKERAAQCCRELTGKEVCEYDENFNLKQLDYQPDVPKIDLDSLSAIYDKDQERLLDAVENWREPSSEIGWEMSKKLASWFRDEIMNSGVNIIGGLLGLKRDQNQTEQITTGKELISFIDNHIHAEQHLDRPSSDMILGLIVVIVIALAGMLVLCLFIENFKKLLNKCCG